jgi:hypothetical protein
MKKFLLKVILLLSFIFSFLLGIEMLNRYKDHSHYRFRSAFFEKNAPELEGIFFGPSLTGRSIIPSAFNMPTANLAVGGSSIPVDHQMFSYAMNKSQPTFVVFDLSSGYIDRKSTLKKSAEILFFYYGIRAKPFELKDYFMSRLPLHRVFTNNNNPIEHTIEGFELSIPPEKDLFRDLSYHPDSIALHFSKSKKSIQLQKTNLKRRAINLALLEDIKVKCREKNIKLIFYSPPKYELYTDHILSDHYTVRQAFLDRSVDNEHVFFWDLESLGAKDPENFFDFIHCTPKGAQLVSREMNRRLGEILSE